MTDKDFQIGQIMARLDVNDERHQANIGKLQQIDETLKELVESITLARGGIRMLFAVGSVGAAIGAFATTMIHWAASHIK